MKDDIAQYLNTILDKIVMYCTACGMQRYVWRGRTTGDEILTGCCNCQRILKREKA